MRSLRKTTTARTKRWQARLEALEARRLMSVYADFNGDGFDDLAIGVPGEDSGAGMVQVLYGSATGLTAAGSQSWTQSSLGTDSSEGGDNFGASLAAGDFNNDGRSDLAVGVPGEDIGSAIDAGSVHFILGSASGLTGAGDYVLHQDTNRVREVAETGDTFGKSLAAGDWNNDGFIDLAVGVPGQSVSGNATAGAVHVFYGGGVGIKPPGNQTFNLDSPGMAGTPTTGDGYGSALTAGDYNGDGRDDLAIGTPTYDVTGAPDTGAVAMILGSATGLSPVGSKLLIIPDTGSQLGIALASGDFDNDGFDDVVAGAPLDDVETQAGAGEIGILEGSAIGLSFVQFYQEQNFGGHAFKADDNFGAALTAGDFNNDGFVDIAIGIPGEETGVTANVGNVIVALGSTTGITTTGSVTLAQSDVGGADEADDHFGETLGVGDFDGSGSTDLVIGTPHEDVGTFVDAGTVYVAYSLFGPSPQTWSQETPGIFDTAETGDSFGGGLDAGGRSSNDGDSGRRAAFMNGIAPLADRPTVREITPTALVSDHVDTFLSVNATLDDDAPATTSIVTRSVRSATLPPLFAFDLDLNNPPA